jgi:hypothetical protein
MMPGRFRVLVVIMALPPMLASSWALAIATRERTGSAPVTATAFRNSAEAAAAGDAATMLRLLRLGDNPTWVHQVHPDLISSRIVRVTTLEAALWARTIHIIRALDREGAIVGDDQRRELACLARDLDLTDVADYLAPGARCVAGEAMNRVLARSASPETDDEE